jgi:hypothetical protein
MGWGGWEGLPLEDICSQMTLVSASIWTQQLDNCKDLIERKFQTYLITVGSAAYLYLILKVFSYIWLRYFVLAPLLAEIKKHFPERIHFQPKNALCGTEKEEEYD